MSDFPFYEVAAGAKEMVDLGNTVYQKFTCGNCGSRQTMDTPNVFFKTGKCQECGYVTDIEAKGCNYLLVRDLR